MDFMAQFGHKIEAWIVDMFFIVFIVIPTFKQILKNTDHMQGSLQNAWFW